MRLYVNEDFSRNRCDIYLVQDIGGENIFIGYDGENTIEQKFEKNTVIDTQTIKPLLTIPHHLKDILVREFTNYGRERNISNGDENHLKGRLEATKEHLNDMRDLVKHFTTDNK
jgi:hypothetical protein